MCKVPQQNKKHEEQLLPLPPGHRKYRDIIDDKTQSLLCILGCLVFRRYPQLQICIQSNLLNTVIIYIRYVIDILRNSIHFFRVSLTKRPIKVYHYQCCITLLLEPNTVSRVVFEVYIMAFETTPRHIRPLYRQFKHSSILKRHRNKKHFRPQILICEKSKVCRYKQLTLTGCGHNYSRENIKILYFHQHSLLRPSSYSPMVYRGSTQHATLSQNKSQCESNNHARTF